MEARQGSGMERPEELPPSDGPVAVDRVFAFVDLSGFTAFTQTSGVKQAVQVLASFRLVVSEVAARRGVRVAKWLGDGAMLVGVVTGPTVATVAELVARFSTTELQLRAGVAQGPVILFNGDDYIGKAVNLAARLCDAAAPGEILAAPPVPSAAPPWVRVSRTRSIALRGVGRVDDVVSLCLADDVALPPATATADPS